MKKIYFTIVLSLAVIISQAQRGAGHGGGGSGAGGSTPAAGAQQGAGQGGGGAAPTVIIPGYVYNIDAYQLLHYITKVNGKVYDTLVYPKEDKKVSITQDSGKLNVQIFSSVGNIPPAKADTTGQMSVYSFGPPQKTKVSYRAIKDGDSANNFFLIIPKRIKESDTIWSLTVPYSYRQAGVLTVPFRLRFGFKNSHDTAHTDFAANINVSAYYGWSLGSTTFYYNPSYSSNNYTWTAGVFLGPTAIPLSQTNTSDKSLYSTNQPVVSGGAFISYALGSFNLGFFVGDDIPIGGEAYTWYYAFKPWIGVGIGFNLGILGSNSTIYSEGIATVKPN